MAQGKKGTGPILPVTCRYAPCGKVFYVRTRYEQARRVTCSSRCNALHRTPLTKAAADRGRAQAALVKRRQVLAKLDGLTVLEAFRLGYDTGLRSKLVQVRRRYVLVPKAEAA